MKNLIVFVFLFFALNLTSRPLTIINGSNIPIDVIVWKDSKVIYHQIMNPSDQIKFDDIGDGLLLQYKLIGVTVNDGLPRNCDRFHILDNGYIEVELNSKFFANLEPWFKPKITSLSLDFVEPKNVLRA